MDYQFQLKARLKLNSLNTKYRYVSSLLLSFLVLACTEEIALEQKEDFVSALVIEATITDENKHQKILLSRSFELDSLGARPESDASITVVGSDGQSYSFTEEETGEYRSTSTFAAQENIDYQLKVTTKDGRTYGSTSMNLSGTAQIDNLYVERGFDENNDEGVSVLLNTPVNPNNIGYYKFEYEETYKIIAPLYNPLELIINNDDFPYQPEDLAGLSPSETVDFFVIRQFREAQELVCYNTVKSNEIILADTNELDNQALDEFRIRFLSRDNYIISHRYSILVKMYAQSLEAHLFYKTLKNISEGGSLFSDVQPGFVAGNVSSKTNKNELVIGFFEVSAANEQRLYFNYEDLFPGEDLPPYYLPCDDLFSPALFVASPSTGEIGSSPIQDAVKSGQQYYNINLNNDNNQDDINVGTPYQMVLPYCGDCTVLGQTDVPSWWEE